jgi:hypothetical protein
VHPVEVAVAEEAAVEALEVRLSPSFFRRYRVADKIEPRLFNVLLF